MVNREEHTCSALCSDKGICQIASGKTSRDNRDQPDTRLSLTMIIAITRDKYNLGATNFP